MLGVGIVAQYTMQMCAKFESCMTTFVYKQVAVLVRQVGFGHTVLCSWNFEILCPDFDAFSNCSSTIQKIASLMVQAIDCRGISQLQNAGLRSIAA